MMKKGITRCTFVVLVLALLVTQALAAEPFGAVDIPKVQQAKSNWCWAACGESIARYYGNSITQATFAQQVKGNTLNVTAADSEVQSGLEHWGISGTLVQDSVAFSTISSNIKAGNPLYAGWSWSSGGGHALVLDGYDSTSVTNSVEYMDPGDGAFHVSTYTSFKGGDSYNHVWDGTIYNF